MLPDCKIQKVDEIKSLLKKNNIVDAATNLMLDIPDSQGLYFLFLGSLNPSTFRQRNSNKSGKSFLKSL